MRLVFKVYRIYILFTYSIHMICIQPYVNRIWCTHDSHAIYIWFTYDLHWLLLWFTCDIYIYMCVYIFVCFTYCLHMKYVQSNIDRTSIAHRLTLYWKYIKHLPNFYWKSLGDIYIDNLSNAYRPPPLGNVIWVGTGRVVVIDGVNIGSFLQHVGSYVLAYVHTCMHTYMHLGSWIVFVGSSYIHASWILDLLCWIFIHTCIVDLGSFVLDLHTYMHLGYWIFCVGSSYIHASWILGLLCWILFVFIHWIFECSVCP